MIDPVQKTLYFEIIKHADHVEVRRTDIRFDVDEDLFERCRPAIQTLEGLRHLGLLLDLRVSVGRVEPEFEQKIARVRQELNKDHPRVAILVKTAVGRLQISRQLREDDAGSHQRVFSDEEPARSFARGTLQH